MDLHAMLTCDRVHLDVASERFAVEERVRSPSLGAGTKVFFCPASERREADRAALCRQSEPPGRRTVIIEYDRRGAMA